MMRLVISLAAEFWRQMGYGIEWMNMVALWVASLPGAVGHVTTFGTGPLLLATAGLLVIGLFKTPLRWSGLVLAALGVALAASTPRPDVLLAADGRTFAVRRADGLLTFHHSGGDTFAIKARNGSRPTPTRATITIASWGRVLPATPPAASANSPMALLSPTTSNPMRSRKIAAAPLSS
jgi:hypothetical protein